MMISIYSLTFPSLSHEMNLAFSNERIWHIRRRLPFEDMDRNDAILDLVLKPIQRTWWGTCKDSAVYCIVTVVARAEEVINIFFPMVPAT